MLKAIAEKKTKEIQMVKLEKFIHFRQRITFFTNPFCSSYLIGSHAIFTPQHLRAVGILFSAILSGWAGGRRENVCPGCISETVRCRKLILGRDIG